MKWRHMESKQRREQERAAAAAAAATRISGSNSVSHSAQSPLLKPMEKRKDSSNLTSSEKSNVASIQSLGKLFICLGCKYSKL